MRLFVTATGTDIGKTHIACGLLAAARARGQRLGALKPVMSGYDPAHPATSDAGRLLAALGARVDAGSVAAISPWRFAAPLSPDQAAAAEGRAIDMAALVAFCRQPGDLLIEGVGGVMVPLTPHATVLDWILLLGCPVLLVCGSYLGTLSHTLTALAVLAARGVKVAAVVMNESEGGVALADNTASLQAHCPDVPVLCIRRGADAAGFFRLLGVVEEG